MSDTYTYRSAHNSSFLTLRVIQLVVYYQRCVLIGWATTRLWVYSFRRIQKRIFDPRFTKFRGRKEREIRNWICDLGNLSQTRAIYMTAWASQEMTCFLLFDKLRDYTVQNFLWSAVRITTMEHKQIKKLAC